MDTKENWHNDVETQVIDDDADLNPMDQLDPTGVLVKPKWRGTSQDRLDMETLGRQQVLRVRRQSWRARRR